MSPLQNVDNPYFKNIFDYLEISKSGLSVMSRRTLGRCIDVSYEKTLTDLKKQLRDIKTVCTTADIWSGKKRNVFSSVPNTPSIPPTNVKFYKRTQSNL